MSGKRGARDGRDERERRERREGDWLRAAVPVPCIFLTFSLAVVVGCSGPKPILYPNDHYKKMGDEAAEADIKDCRELAEKAGATPGAGKAGEVAKNTAISGGIGAAAGAVGGAIVGAAGSGSAVGAASGVVWGLFGSLFRAKEPSEAYKGYVTRCLKEKGYDPTGWQ